MSTSVPDPLALFVEAIRAPLNMLIIGAVWSAALVPLLVILFFWSTPSLRRQPIFIMNVAAVVLGIIVGILDIKLSVGRILNPTQAFPASYLLAFTGMVILLPVFVDCILAFRLYAVYPPRTTKKPLLALIFLPIILFKIARLTNLLVFIVQYAIECAGVSDLEANILFQQIWDHGVATKIEWIAQVVDNCYTSGWFLWRLRTSYSLERGNGIVMSQGSSYTTRRIQTLFYWALSSFFFPCVFSIIQVAIVFNNRDFFLGAYIFVTNLYLEIICVLLATIWTASTKQMSINESPGSTFKNVSIRVARETEISNTIASDDHELHDFREHRGGKEARYYVEGKPEVYGP
ncbi:hypothetical protein PM082_012723 [Marasmius tenuissimus]|nr:hypothetical protein PM082_012723 [Marasmius tenuissimus]